MAQTNVSDSQTLQGKLVVGAIRLLGLLPLAMARHIGAGLGWLGWITKSTSAKTSLRNIQICFPNMSTEEQKLLAKQSMRHTGMLGLEICVLLRRPSAWLDKQIVAVDDAALHDAIAAGNGVIVLAPHIGNWEILGKILPKYGPMTTLYQPPKQSYLEELIIASRQSTGAELVPTTRKGVVKLMNSVKNGGITGILPDQNPAEGSGQFALFYGYPAYTMTLIHGFVRRVPCPVIAAVAKRVKKGFEVIYREVPNEIYAEDQAESLLALNQAVEDCIQLCPEQYQWEYKRFRVRPDGYADPYRTDPFKTDPLNTTPRSQQQEPGKTPSDNKD